MIYEEQAPPPDLQRYVECFWLFHGEPHDRERFDHVIVPDGTFSLVLRREREAAVSLTGPSPVAHKTYMTRTTFCFGVRLRPAALKPLTGLDAVRFAGRMTLAADLPAPLVDGMRGADAPDWPQIVARLEGLVRNLARTAPTPDAAVQAAAEDLARDFDLGCIEHRAREAGITVRHLRRRFVAAVGLGPKAYAQARRIREAVLLLLETANGLSGVAATSGFADQAHFSREFAQRLHLSPRAARAYLARIRHIMGPNSSRPPSVAAS